MNFNYFLFDLDNSLVHIPTPSVYFDEILQDTLKILSTHDKLPSFKERNKLWSSGDNYIDFLIKWGVEKHDEFWKHFDKIDHGKRKDLVEKNRIYLYEDATSVLK
ncbi:MAG: hypothetical protein GF383_14320, partial [Candidatus Lokiarchaeota archaeon]|nr:hypothetical protein [Candidatus Lokiarchaeota archaeon]MBD3342543.1 hypothetical protein [Candidatus Lokiarchaeota archaeon]